MYGGGWGASPYQQQITSPAQQNYSSPAYGRAQPARRRSFGAAVGVPWENANQSGYGWGGGGVNTSSNVSFVGASPVTTTSSTPLRASVAGAGGVSSVSGGGVVVGGVGSGASGGGVVRPSGGSPVRRSPVRVGPGGQHIIHEYGPEHTRYEVLQHKDVVVSPAETSYIEEGVALSGKDKGKHVTVTVTEHELGSPSSSSPAGKAASPGSATNASAYNGRGGGSAALVEPALRGPTVTGEREAYWRRIDRLRDDIETAARAIGQPVEVEATCDKELITQAVESLLPSPTDDPDSLLGDNEPVGAAHSYQELQNLAADLEHVLDGGGLPAEALSLYELLLDKTKEALKVFTGTRNKHAEDKFIHLLRESMTELNSFLRLDFPAVTDLHRSSQANIQACRDFEVRRMEGVMDVEAASTDRALYSELDELVALNAERILDTESDLAELDALRVNGLEHHMHDLRAEAQAEEERLADFVNGIAARQVEEKAHYATLTADVERTLAAKEREIDAKRDGVRRLTAELAAKAKALTDAQMELWDLRKQEQLLRKASKALAHKHDRNTGRVEDAHYTTAQRVTDQKAAQLSAAVADDIVTATLDTLTRLETQRRSVLVSMRANLIIDALQLLFRKYHRTALKLLDATTHMDVMQREKEVFKNSADARRVDDAIRVDQEALANLRQQLDLLRARREELQTTLTNLEGVDEADVTRMDKNWQSVLESLTQIEETRHSQIASMIALARV